MLKKSNDNNVVVPTSKGRGVENSGIFTQSSKQSVIRNNYFDGSNSGVDSHISESINEEIDIYDNVFLDNFDAIECDGKWSNLRVWNNEIIRPMAGFSAAPPEIGPRYYYRNLVHEMRGRKNVELDPYFVACQPVGDNFHSQSVGLKTNSDAKNYEEGNMYLFNNTFHSDDSLGFTFTSWKAEWKKALFINNSYSHGISHPIFYFNLASTTVNSDFQISSNSENYYSFNDQSPIAVVKLIHGYYNCVDIHEVSDLQDVLSDISGSSKILILNPIQKNPDFSSLEIGGFELNYGSPLIDAGSIIPGFYDYEGDAPDIGAKESNYSLPTSSRAITKPLEIVKIYPNPTSGSVIIDWQNEYQKAEIRIFNQTGSLIKNIQNVDKERPLKIDFSSLSNGMYILEIVVNETSTKHKLIKPKP